MSHYIYHTEGIVLGSFNVEESSRFLQIFTRDLGLVGAKAQGLRELKSKLRYSLQDFYHSRIDFVRGKDIWRITNASKKDSYNNLLDNGEKLKIFAELLFFVRRLVVGEEKSKEIFDFLLNSALFLDKKDLNETQLKSFLLISEIRILYYLGYFDPKENFLPFVGFSVWTQAILDNFISVEKEAKIAIETSLEFSHL